VKSRPVKKKSLFSKKVAGKAIMFAFFELAKSSSKSDVRHNHFAFRTSWAQVDSTWIYIQIILFIKIVWRALQIKSHAWFQGNISRGGHIGLNNTTADVENDVLRGHRKCLDHHEVTHVYMFMFPRLLSCTSIYSYSMVGRQARYSGIRTKLYCFRKYIYRERIRENYSLWPGKTWFSRRFWDF
jgi:hypothetical protein